MTRMRHRVTGSEVVVSDEKAEQMAAMGYDVVDSKTPAKKAPAKAAAKSANKQ
jgi:hypothetical protein